METKDWISLASIVVSISAMLVTIYFALRARRDVQFSQRLQKFSLEQEYLAKLRVWGNKVVEAMTRSVFLCDVDPVKCPEFFEKRNSLLQDFSTLIDQGRWFFPNLKEGEHGLWKASAYRGFRQPILDKIVGVYDQINVEQNYKEQASNKSLKKIIGKYKREFVSIVQEILDPREAEKDLDGILNS